MRWSSDNALAMSLAVVAGYVDASGLRAFGTYVSFMSGNTTQAGSMIGQGHFGGAVPGAIAIVFFFAGSFAGTWFSHVRPRHSRRHLFTVVAALLALTTAAMQTGSVQALFAIAVLALAMGMMNTALSQVGSERVSLTFVTGDLSRVGSDLALAFVRAPVPAAAGPWDTHLRRAFVPASVWTAFIAGAVLSGIATSHLGTWMLVPPIVVLVTLLVFSEARPSNAG